MSGATAFHGLPYPLGSDTPAGPVQIKALADATDKQLPIVSAAQPAHASGRLWWNPTNKTLMVSDGTAWTFVNRMTAQVRRISAAQPVASGVLSAVGWNTTDFNVGINTSGTGLVVPVAGFYNVHFRGEFAGNATGRRFACILKNGTEASEVNRHTVAVNSSNGTGLILAGIAVMCNANDTIGVGVFQDSGVTLNFSANASLCAELAY